MKERSYKKKQKNTVVKFWRSKGKYTVTDDNTSSLLYYSKQACADFIVDSVTVSCYHSLWQFMTKCNGYYYKMRQLLYYKMRQKFIKKCISFFVTKCDSFITKYYSYYKLLRFYYKMQQSLKNATFATNCGST